MENGKSELFYLENTVKTVWESDDGLVTRRNGKEQV